jgi:hypothetical protein
VLEAALVSKTSAAIKCQNSASLRMTYV